MKKIKQKFYTTQKWIYKRKKHQHYIINSNDGTLYSKGFNKTKIKAEDLPDYFVYGRYHKLWGYLSASGIKDLYFKECRMTRESIKDDNLYISYHEELNKEAINTYDFENQNFDYIVDSVFILDFLDKILSLDEYKSTDIFQKAIYIKEEFNKRIERTQKEKDEKRH